MPSVESRAWVVDFNSSTELAAAGDNITVFSFQLFYRCDSGASGVPRTHPAPMRIVIFRSVQIEAIDRRKRILTEFHACSIIDLWQ